MSQKAQPFTWVQPDLASALDGFPEHVQVIQTTVGDPSVVPYGTQNLAFHVKDSDQQVHENRSRLLTAIRPHEVTYTHWLTQVHGTDSVYITSGKSMNNEPGQADALITDESGHALSIMTADCLPVVMTDAAGIEVAAIHAGWRGLQAGIIQETAKNMMHQPAFAWIGAAISQAHFEVGQEVVDAFTQHDTELMRYFSGQQISHTDETSSQKSSEAKYLADLSGIAMCYLARLGIKAVNSNLCTYADERFYSYRQATHQGDSRTGRIATLIWKH